MSLSFQRQLTVHASTKRPPAVTAGKRGAPVAYLDQVRITPLFPITTEVAARFMLDSPVGILQSYTSEEDIVAGDVLVIGANEYPIKGVAPWPWSLAGDERVTHMVVEDIKR